MPDNTRISLPLRHESRRRRAKLHRCNSLGFVGLWLCLRPLESPQQGNGVRFEWRSQCRNYNAVSSRYPLDLANDTGIAFPLGFMLENAKANHEVEISSSKGNDSASTFLKLNPFRSMPSS